ncbi:hypothetical protein GWC77_24135 [Paraburkholderia sp. NMBU_R16]|uniref:hypothetical protein n=1 Tax=Paraburkholderia sp. NMBU_R16 TaxID=2698676 RepID=UPI0015671F34|nr:hypothetical protein [Paraburkholderia sp. NMBU_R16]NRO99000.1 hypothetical protein [Paraburkholderia sp. NMBU_R16]
MDPQAWLTQQCSGAALYVARQRVLCDAIDFLQRGQLFETWVALHGWIEKVCGGMESPMANIFRGFSGSMYQIVCGLIDRID